MVSCIFNIDDRSVLRFHIVCICLDGPRLDVPPDSCQTKRRAFEPQGSGRIRTLPSLKMRPELWCWCRDRVSGECCGSRRIGVSGGEESESQSKRSDIPGIARTAAITPSRVRTSLLGHLRPNNFMGMHSTAPGMITSFIIHYLD